MVMRLNNNTDLSHFFYHLTAQVMIGVSRADRKITALETGFVTKVWFFESRCIPRTFNGVYFVKAGMLILLIADFIEDEEFRFRTYEACVCNSGPFQICGTLPGHVSWISCVVLPCGRVNNICKHTHGGISEERVHYSRISVGYSKHVGYVYPLPAANTRTIKSHTVCECAFVPDFNWKRAVLPRSKQVTEFQINHVGAVLFCKFKKLFWCHLSIPS